MSRIRLNCLSGVSKIYTSFEEVEFVGYSFTLLDS